MRQGILVWDKEAGYIVVDEKANLILRVDETKDSADVFDSNDIVPYFLRQKVINKKQQLGIK